MVDCLLQKGDDSEWSVSIFPMQSIKKGDRQHLNNFIHFMANNTSMPKRILCSKDDFEHFGDIFANVNARLVVESFNVTKVTTKTKDLSTIEKTAKSIQKLLKSAYGRATVHTDHTRASIAIQLASYCNYLLGTRAFSVAHEDLCPSGHISDDENPLPELDIESSHPTTSKKANAKSQKLRSQSEGRQRLLL